MKNASLLILGLIAGFGSAALGIGGGVILVPTSIFILRNDIKKAIGTSLAGTSAIALAGIISHYIIRAGNIKFIVALFVVIGSVIGAGIGARLANIMSNRILNRLFALLLFLIALKLTGIIKMPTELFSEGPAYLPLLTLGLFTGFISALLGIGGGVVMVPAFYLFFGLSIHEAVATSLMVVFPTSLCGAMFYKKLGNIDTSPLKFLVPAALLGAVLGAITTNNAAAGTLRIVFAIVMLISCFRFLLQKEQPT